MAINILQNVITYNESGLALLENLNCFIATANTKFDKFNDQIPKNLGDTVSFDLAPRFNTVNSLVIAIGPANQRVQNLSVTGQASTSYAFSNQQFIFNARDYMERWGKSAIAQIGAKVEADVASVAETHTYRFFGDGLTPINTYLQLATALAQFDEFGSVKSGKKGYLANTTVPGIINSGLNQFTTVRGNREALSWEIGEFAECDWYRSNLLPTHVAGTVGNEGSTLTVVSTTLNADGSIASITFSGAPASDPAAVKAYDKFRFNDGVAGHPNLRFLTFIGGQVSQAPVQFAAQFDAASDGGGLVTVTLGTAAGALPLLAGVPTTTTFGINNQVVAGMQVSVLPNHRCGLITSGNPLMLAMPKLPEQEPFPTSVAMDPETGVSIRQYFGTIFGQNQQVMVHDCIWAKTLVPENAMMIAFPM